MYCAKNGRILHKMDVLYIKYLPHSAVQIVFETFFIFKIFKKYARDT